MNLLNKIALLGNDKEKFSITPSTHSGYYTISIGEIKYHALDFSKESLLEALLFLNAHVNLKRGYYDSGR